MRKSPRPDWAEAPATLAIVIGPLKFLPSSPKSIFFRESSVNRLMVGAFRPFHHRIQRAETNLAQHLGRPFTAFDARTEITAPRITLSASGKCQRHINTLPVTLNLENRCRAGQNLDRVDYLLPIVKRLPIQADQPIAELNSGGLGRNLRDRAGRSPARSVGAMAECRAP